jgi:hypothetical protein
MRDLNSNPCKLALLIGFVALTELLPFTLALANDCDDILTPALLNRSVRASDENFAQAARNWACAASLSEINNAASNATSRSGGGSVQILTYLGIGGHGSGSSSTSTQQFGTWKQQNCSQGGSDMQHSAFEYFAQQSVNVSVVDAWKSCKLRSQNLSCWVSPHGNQIEFHYNWNSTAIDLPRVRDFTVVRGSSPPETLSPASETIYIGEQTKTISRISTGDTLVTLNIVLSDRYVHSCVGFVPGHSTLPSPAQAIPVSVATVMGVWCSEVDSREYTEEWVYSDERHFFLKNWECKGDCNKGTFDALKSQRMSAAVQFRPIGTNELEIHYPGDFVWYRWRMTGPNELTNIGTLADGSIPPASGGSNFRPANPNNMEIKRRCQ